jgi:hypothetical protein
LRASALHNSRRGNSGERVAGARYYDARRAPFAGPFFGAATLGSGSLAHRLRIHPEKLNNSKTILLYRPAFLMNRGTTEGHL